MTCVAQRFAGSAPVPILLANGADGDGVDNRYSARKRIACEINIGAITANPSANMDNPGAIMINAPANASARSQAFISTSK